ncbi:MAG: hypothetical protein A3B90_00395 [Candidatus Magasanikbacteria bacterium RIFCSPHIGHO2_02_FULL_41_13]|uniref:Glycosyltransferase subfamily 4-like N-terminal domain-containing protein n=1 Tax=Candidatus Magasanikbacteria bacterium RIFCSPHIGHO2_02_FULL_41_13 TaxID=1798676 RepID=A0A1F6M4D7_9BACT|nr:MAG: hypothetical protein A3B90_00395 [Candidatus Magasanikbacteria bacterium RIFCSPHIGHO2_02_FULL_41_13]
MKSQVKILFVITQGFWGGAQKYITDLAGNLGPNYELAVALGNDESKDFEKKLKATNPNIAIYPLKHLKREISPLHDILAIAEIRQLYKKLGPNIIHLNSSKAGILGSLAKIPQSKIIYTAHGWVFLEPLSPIRKTLYRFLEKYTACYKDAIIVLSDEDRRVAKLELHIEDSKLHTIPLGISEILFLDKNEARRQIAEKNPHIDTNKLWSLSIANYYPTKGLDILVEAVSTLSPEEQSKFQFCIIGDGPERTRLQTDINLNHLENTIFLLPFIEKAAALLKAADLFILPSRKEGLPYAILEALQADLPLIATKVGGIPSILQNTPETALIAPEAPRELTSAIQKFLLTNRVEKKREYSMNTLSAMIEETTALYQMYS